MTYKKILLFILILIPYIYADAQDISSVTYTSVKNLDGYIPMDNVPIVDPYKAMNKAGNARKASNNQTRPDHVYNNKTIFFPPNINQGELGCCGSTSTVCYCFTHEWNAYKGLNGEKPENQFPALFTWLTSYQGFGIDEIMAGNGVPKVPTYGGRRESALFGPQKPGDVDYGWMQGYSKWYDAMCNRLSYMARFPYNLTTPEGQEMLKQWLWNHCGDTSFSAGGCVTLGVAFGERAEIYKGGVKDSVVQYYNITRSTSSNVQYGLANMKYLTDWSAKPINHGMTIVGYDDRIELDVNGDGICSDEERGAWILQNSHADNWMNGGWVYLPYSLCYGQRVGNTTCSAPLDPVRYYIRKDYVPKQTVRMKMDYTRRSEIYIHAGVSQDVNATTPDYEIDFTHFKYMSNPENLDASPEVPMLGRWKDGMHYEPMEFGYDLTDLIANIDPSKPYKVFIYVTTKCGAFGRGKVYDCTILDYSGNNLKEYSTGITDGNPKEVANGGNTITMTCSILGNGHYAPQNLQLSGSTLSWTAPQVSAGALYKYRVYRNDVIIAELPTSSSEFTIPDQHGIYYVTALYSDGKESVPSNCKSPEVNENSTSATFEGDINGTYFVYIRDMVFNHKLTDIDMLNANVISGGRVYDTKNKTIDNEFPKSIFEGCTKLKSIVLPKSITSIGKRAFMGATISKVAMQEGLAIIDENAFSRCDNLEEVKLPGSVCSIQIDNFAYNKQFRKMIAGPNITAFGQGVFYLNSNRTSLYFYTRKVPTAAAYFGQNTGVDVHVYPDMVNAFKKHKDWNRSHITIIGDLNESLSPYAANDLTPPSDVNINDGELSWNAALGNIDYYNIYCNGKFVTSITAGKNSFPVRGTHGLYHITAVSGNKESSKSGYASTDVNEQSTSAVFVGEINNTYLGYIRDMVLNHNLTKINMWQAEIVSGGEKYCNDTPFSTTSDNTMPVNAFSHCPNLETVILPESLTITEGDAFAYCDNLSKMVFGPSIISVGQGTAYGSKKRMDVYIPTTRVPVGNAYMFHTYGADIHVQPSMVNSFRNTAQWNDSQHYNIIGDLTNELTLKGKTLSYQIPKVVTPTDLNNALATISQTYTAIDLEDVFLSGFSSSTFTNMYNGTNIITFVSASSGIKGTNIVNDGVCDNLVLTDKKDFMVQRRFIATQSSYKRAFAYEPTTSEGDSWYSVVLPFDLELSASDGFEVLSNAQVVNGGISFKKSQSIRIPGQTPFLIRPTVENCANELHGSNNSRILAGYVHSNGLFEGTFVTIPAGQATGLLILRSDGRKFARATNKAAIPAFRAYIDDSENPAKLLDIIIDDETSSVNDISSRKLLGEYVDVYTIDGKLIRKGVAKAEALREAAKGVYKIITTVNGNNNKNNQQK